MAHYNTVFSQLFKLNLKKWVFTGPQIGFLFAIFVVGIVCGFCFGIAATDKILSFTFVNMLPAMVTLVAAFGGAWFAFKMQNDKQEQKERNRKLTAGNLAIFNIARMINRLASYNKSVILPVKDHPLLIISLAETIELATDNFQLDLDSLAFLFETNHGDTIGNVSVAELNFWSLLRTIDDRSELHRNEVKPALGKAMSTLKTEPTEEDIKIILGEPLFERLKFATTQVVTDVARGMINLRKVGNELSLILKEILPGMSVISITEDGEVADDTDKQGD